MEVQAYKLKFWVCVITGLFPCINLKVANIVILIVKRNKAKLQQIIK